MKDRSSGRRFPAGTSLFMNRRQMLQTSAVAGLATAGLLTGLTPALAAPKRGGTLRAAKGHGQTSDSLDPALYENGFMIAQAYGMHGYPHRHRGHRRHRFQPELAESWEASADAAKPGASSCVAVTTYPLRQVRSRLRMWWPASITTGVKTPQSAAKPLLSAVRRHQH
jgi:hypothetical protein